ncbi:uncharacterized protein YndB with AHSA1/START domain [Prosthecobacter fusiformis]|uniref:Uncharacterized protein YndB with AHSA1/START domain n=1 Tax=Prosthecobacter fusiformis TaxID=48464 RepID=A0A4R7RXR3_9BACT|nr:SRPBCC domain-containing protein [Prosthecobacter fusiformis]TDU70650.1 uncharacterized protein YndB with AHSA1/START domain [Prosthecobacter fusiformis]
MNASSSSAPAGAIVSTRHFNVGRDRLFEAFSDPAQLIQWWGPKGFTNTFHKFDLRPGGDWLFTMHGPDGKDYDTVKKFTEVIPCQRIVFQHLESVHRFDMTLIFEAEPNGSRFTWHMLFESPAEAEKLRSFITAANEENFDRLEAHLSSHVSADEWSMTRSFEASPADLFQAWTDAATFSQWWGPHAFTNAVCITDPRPGGEYRVTMRSPDGTDYPLHGRYLEIQSPDLWVMTMDCTDHPPAWHDVVKPERTPEETNPAGVMRLSVSLIEGDGHTRMDLRIRFVSPAIRDAFVRMGIQDGWGESLDSLAALLAAKESK